MHALFKDGRQVSKAHSTRVAVAIEAFEMGLVVTSGVDFPGDVATGPGLVDGYEIKEIQHGHD